MVYRYDALFDEHLGRASSMMITQTTLRARTAVAMLAAVVGAASFLLVPKASVASVVANGNVTPSVPAGGGNIVTPLVVGDVGVGVVTITGGTPLTVSGGGSATVGNTATGFGFVSLSGLGSDLTTGNDLIIGNAGAGRVTATDLSKIFLTDDLLMGIAVDSSAQLLASDLGTTIDVTDTVNVGSLGTAVIEISKGAKLLADDTVVGTAAGSTGRVTITGLQTLWQQANSLTVGDGGRGTFQVFDQAKLATTNAIVGNGATGVGDVEISGAGSIWNIGGFLNLGVNGIGTINVLDGARVTNASTLRLATVATGEGHVTVSGANSTLNVGTTATIGEFGLGTLDVLSGGRVNSQGAIMGDNSTARGEVTVDGQGSTWQITGTLDISDPGEATLTIGHGGLVKVSGLVSIRAAGTLAFDGGRIELGVATGINNQGLVTGGGTINGSITNTLTGEIRIGSGEHLLVNNTITNSGLLTLDGGEFEVIGPATNSLDIDVRNATLRFQNGLANNANGALAIVGGDVDVFGAVTNAANARVVVGGAAHAVLHDAFTNNGCCSSRRVRSC